MKKLTAILLALALLCGASAALAQDNDLYVDTAKALAKRLTTLATDQAYLQMMGANPDMLSAVKPMAALDAKEIKSCQFVTLPESGEAAAVAMGVFGMMDSLTPVAREEAAGRMYGALATMIGSARGVNHIALSSLLSASTAFVKPEGFAPCAVFVDYGGELGVLALFTPAGEEVAGATATFFYKEDLKSTVWTQLGVIWALGAVTP